MTCTIDGCIRAHHGRGWCKAHYWRWMTYGDPLFLKGVYPRNGRRAGSGTPPAAMPLAIDAYWVFTGDGPHCTEIDQPVSSAPHQSAVGRC